MVQLKYLIHLLEKRKSRHPEQSKEEALQGSSSATTKHDGFKALSKEQQDELVEWRKSQKNGSKVNKHNQGNSNNKSKTDNKSMKKMICVAVASYLSQLAGSDNLYDREEK